MKRSRAHRHGTGVGLRLEELESRWTPAFMAVEPVGSLIYESVLADSHSTVGEVDSFSIDVDAGQTISIVGTPQASALDLSLTLRDPSSNPIAVVDANGPDLEELIQTIPTVAGTFTLEVGSAAGTGAYEIQIVLNAALEAESHAGATNNLLATAQAIDASFLALTTDASRGALLGQSDGFGFIQSQFVAANPFDFAFAGLPTPTGGGAIVVTGDFQAGLFPGLTLNAEGVVTAHLLETAVGNGSQIHFQKSIPLSQSEIQTLIADGSMNMSILHGVYDQLSDVTVTISYADGNVQSDFYQFDLDTGDVIDLTLNGHPDYPIGFQLKDALGTTLAVADLQPVPRNVDLAMRDFIAPAAGTYVVEVFNGLPGGDYSLLVTQNAAFDLEVNNTFAGAQDISATGHVLGYPSQLAHEEIDVSSSAIDVDGNVAILGEAGAAHIFRHDGTEWIQEQTLTGSFLYGFGRSVAIDGDWALVGSPREVYSGMNPGAAHLYRNNGSSWVLEKKLTPSDPKNEDDFGVSVDLQGNTAIVGARREDTGGGNSGSAYVFEYDGLNWNEEQILFASDASLNMHFGEKVSLSGDALVIGASATDTAYMFRFDGNNWVEEQILPDFDIGASLSGDLLALGGNDVVNLYRFDGANWNHEQTLTGDAFSYGFGDAVDLDNDVMLVGAHADNEVLTGAGSAFVYRFDGANWNQEQKIVSSVPGTYDRFGLAVGLSGEVGLIGSDIGSYIVPITPLDDYFRFDVQVGEQIQIITTTPADGPNSFGNLLDPRIELYDPTGVLVASDDNSAPDGRNAALTYDATQSGAYRVRVLEGLGEYVLDVSVIAPPTIVDIWARGSAWSASYLNELAATLDGNPTSGSKLDRGATQTESLGWNNLDSLSIAFSEAVTIDPAALEIRGSAPPAGDPISPAVQFVGFDTTTNVATWNFSTLPSGRYILDLDASLVTSTVGRAELDGEWADDVSTQSGDGVAGGDFRFQFNLVHGDTNGDLITDTADLNGRDLPATCLSHFRLTELRSPF